MPENVKPIRQNQAFHKERKIVTCEDNEFATF